MGSPRQPSLVLFPVYINNLPTWTLWSCGRRVSVVQTQRQIHRVLLATDTAAGETMRPRRATRRGVYGQTEAQMRTIRGELAIGRIFTPQMGAPLRIVIFRGAVPLSNPWLEPIR